MVINRVFIDAGIPIARTLVQILFLTEKFRRLKLSRDFPLQKYTM